MSPLSFANATEKGTLARDIGIVSQIANVDHQQLATRRSKVALVRPTNVDTIKNEKFHETTTSEDRGVAETRRRR